MIVPKLQSVTFWWPKTCKIHKWFNGYSGFSLFACDSLCHHSSGSMWNMRQSLLFRLSELKHPSAKHLNTLTTGLWRIITTATAQSFVWATHSRRKTCPITNVANLIPGKSNTVDVWFGFLISISSTMFIVLSYWRFNLFTLVELLKNKLYSLHP